MEVIEENSQENENLEYQMETRSIIDLATNRYEHPRELLGRANINFEKEEEDPRQGQMILHGREILRDEYERERETARARDRQRRREDLEERELQSGLRHPDYDNRVRKRERHHINDTEKGRVIPQEREILRHRYDHTCNEEKHDIVQMKTNTERRRQRREEAEQQEIQEAIRQNNHENRLRQGTQGRNNAKMGQKLVAMGSADQAEFNKEYKDKQLQNYGGTDTVQPGSSAGQQTHYNKKAGRIVWKQIKFAKVEHYSG
ncbi:DEAD-box ATP-dependent RNA helicase 42-like [Papaver somniferum]|uniref:DEAD-box ATP-dependent RNA helicase 42-like n=1 Tax=Papaver somniferum TaxID=3469 RepID=UPI000E6FDCD1|nr:DEAD-box ATP-dependent RNA helicase 42-like [Papaver somniferum]